MASSACVTKCLAILSEAKPDREITPNTVAVYAMALDDVEDRDLERAVARCLKTCRFFPTPAELRDAIGANEAPFVDAEPILDRIRGMSSYLPTCGEIYPRVEAVRTALGEAIGQAYGMAGGGSRLFSSNDTTRSIAHREFAEELAAAAKTFGPKSLTLPPLQCRPQISPVIYGDQPAPALRLLSTPANTRP